MNHTLQLDRRTLLKGLACASLSAAMGGRADVVAGHLLPPWSEGHFDIHQIDTGRGNSALLIFPDGTTMMIDAGGGEDLSPQTSSVPRPDAKRRAGEWQGLYALRHVPRIGYAKPHIDYFLATHVHPDHIGFVSEANPLATDGSYHLTGVSDVDNLIPISTVIDRSYPDYGATMATVSATAKNYFAYLATRLKNGRPVERARVGSNAQIVLRNNPAKYSTFEARILSANAEVWNSPKRAVTSANENIFSVATRFQYGRFSYFSGGDLSADSNDGLHPENDIETAVVRVAGRTEVAVADHHGYFDACGPEFVKQLNAQAYIIPVWDLGHPGTAQMQRLTGNWNGKATQDVFATDLLPANALLNRRFAPQMKSQHGHIVVRVAPGGDSYMIYTVDSTVPDGAVTATFGPYRSRI